MRHDLKWTLTLSAGHLGLLVVEQREAAVERREVREGEVQVRVQAQQRQLAEVRRVHVRHHVEQQAHHAPHHAAELRRELVRCGHARSERYLTTTCGVLVKTCRICKINCNTTR